MAHLWGSLCVTPVSVGSQPRNAVILELQLVLRGHQLGKGAAPRERACKLPGTRRTSLHLSVTYL